MKYRSRLTGQGACFKGMSRTIIITMITDAEKIKLRRKNEQSQWTMKYRSRSAGQGACLNGMSRTITIQGFTLAAITDAKKIKFRRKNEQSQLVKGSKSMCVLEGHVKDNYYAKFHTHSCH